MAKKKKFENLVSKQLHNRLLPSPGKVMIRMYRQGLGDCFLLAFPTHEPEKPVYMLIDCGVLNGQKDGAKRLRQVMQNIAEVTNNHLHVVVATHEHADHLSGFKDRHGIFIGENRIKVDNLWLAWTENPEDSSIEQIKINKQIMAKSLTRLVGFLSKQEQSNLTLRGLLGLMQSAAGFQDFALSVADDPAEAPGLMDYVRDVIEHRPEFFDPGDRPTLPGKIQLKYRVYVLGPPHDRKFLRGENRADRDDATYFSNSPTGLAFLSGLIHYLRGVGDKDDEIDSHLSSARTLVGQRQRFTMDEFQFPFNSIHHRQLRPLSDSPISWEWKTPHQVPAATKQFFKDLYGQPIDGKPLNMPDNSWRNIDHNWLVEAATLGLKLGGDTNNTSLALAIELGDPGKGPVLLFPGDAQVGNWWSWRNLEWKVDGKRITAESLLERTIVYKVSHHASHNGTVKFDRDGKAWGLEMMPKQLLAMIPVDETTARKTGAKNKKWDMPNPELYDALKQKAGRHILRSDDRDDQLEKPGSEWEDVTNIDRLRWRWTGNRRLCAILRY